MARLIILRGPSGSGKSTIANFICGEYADMTAGTLMVMKEADMFFEGQDGYHFDASKLSQAHRWCQLCIEGAMIRGEDAIVSNTSMTKWELNPYLQLAEQYGCEVEIWRTPGPWEPEVLHSRNTHGVPLATLEKQVRKYETLDSEREWYNMEIFNE